MVKTALIVDDSRLARLTLKRLLMKYDIEVHEAEGVVDAERWITHNMLPDIVFMDIMMPELDGYEGLARLRENPDTRDVPVIMYSGDISEESRRKARDGGATGYLPKPADASRLDHLLNALKKRTRTDAPPAAAKEIPTHPRTPAPEAAPPESTAENQPAAPVESVKAEDFAAYVSREASYPRSPEPVYQPEPVREHLQPGAIVVQSADTEELRLRLETLEMQVGAQIRHAENRTKDNLPTAMMADIERLRRDFATAQTDMAKMRQRLGLATMLGASSMIMAILAILWHFVR